MAEGITFKLVHFGLVESEYRHNFEAPVDLAKIKMMFNGMTSTNLLKRIHTKLKTLVQLEHHR
jgi:hypothetical protein